MELLNSEGMFAGCLRYFANRIPAIVTMFIVLASLGFTLGTQGFKISFFSFGGSMAIPFWMVVVGITLIAIPLVLLVRSFIIDSTKKENKEDDLFPKWTQNDWAWVIAGIALFVIVSLVYYFYVIPLVSH